MLHVKKLEKADPDSAVVEKWLAANAEFQKLGVEPSAAMFENDTELALICDDAGPILAVRFHRALRVIAQANPEAAERVEAAQKEVDTWVRRLAAESKCKEVAVSGDSIKKSAGVV